MADSFEARALTLLERLSSAMPQTGPGATEVALDRDALLDVRDEAAVLLYEARGRV